MFRQQIDLTQTPSDHPDWVHGFFYWIKQSKLLFGSDRKIPTSARPVLSVLKHSQYFIVLPVTSKKKPSFYHLTADKPFWKHSKKTDSYLSPNYETLLPDAMPKKAGTLPHTERLAIMNWLKNH